MVIKMLKVGIIGKAEATVDSTNTAKAVGSGELQVFATPSMIALMEKAAYTSVKDVLEEGCGTVGTLIDVKHTSATPVGMKVSCESTLVEIDSRRLVFDIKAYDEKGVIGEARHERFIVANEKFLAKTNSKLSN